MAKEDLIETTATVTEVLPDARYRVKLDNGYELIAYTNGKMRKHHIRIPSLRHSRRTYSHDLSLPVSDLIQQKQI